MNYNSQLQSNNTDLQQVLETLQHKAAGGEQATPVITVSSDGLITATAGAKSSTYQMAFQPAKTITPSTASQIAVSSGYYTGGDIIVAGDSNLVAENIKNGVSIFGISGTAEVGEGDGEDALTAFLTDNITTYTNSNVIQIRTQAFGYCSKLIEINLPNLEKIPGNAFQSCAKLTTINMPKVSAISGYAFYRCYSLPSIYFSLVTSLYGNIFGYCYGLTSVDFPLATSTQRAVFEYCSKLANVNLPQLTLLGSDMFQTCHSLSSVSFPRVANISANAFANCRTLSHLELGASTVCTLANSNVFTSTPFAGYSNYFKGTPHIYVPASLVDAYKSATNWVYFSSYITAIEDMEV